MACSMLAGHCRALPSGLTGVSVTLAHTVAMLLPVMTHATQGGLASSSCFSTLRGVGGGVVGKEGRSRGISRKVQAACTR